MTAKLRISCCMKLDSGKMKIVIVAKRGRTKNHCPLVDRAELYADHLAATLLVEPGTAPTNPLYQSAVRAGNLS
jgi:hypothetical protein